MHRATFLWYINTQISFCCPYFLPSINTQSLNFLNLFCIVLLISFPKKERASFSQKRKGMLCRENDWSSTLRSACQTLVLTAWKVVNFSTFLKLMLLIPWFVRHLLVVCCVNTNTKGDLSAAVTLFLLFPFQFFLTPCVTWHVSQLIEGNLKAGNELLANINPITFKVLMNWLWSYAPSPCAIG